MMTTKTSMTTERSFPAASSAGSQAPTSAPLSTDHLAPTSLAELNSAAGLLTRVDRKYLVPLERAQELVGGLTSEARVLDIDGRRRFSYASTYFDTPGLEAFMLTARKRRRRFKVRTRTYLDTGLCFLEVKTRGARGTTVKRRMGYHPELPANRWYRTLTHELADLFGTDRSSLESIGATRATASAA